MPITSRLSQPQKIVVVVALGAALLALGSYLVSLGAGSTTFGWYAYAPLTSASYNGAGWVFGSRLSFWQHGWAHLLLWLVLALVWALASLWLLRPARQSPPPAPDAT